VNQYLLEHLDDAAWRAAPPGGKGRTAAAIVAHMHAVRGMWLKAMGEPVPDPLDTAACTRAERRRARREPPGARRRARPRLAGDGRVKGFKPDAVGLLRLPGRPRRPPPRQVAMLARQAGHPLPKGAAFGLWEWGSRGREVGA
jgi:hypothetical protein